MSRGIQCEQQPESPKTKANSITWGIGSLWAFSVRLLCASLYTQDCVTATLTTSKFYHAVFGSLQAISHESYADNTDVVQEVQSDWFLLPAP